MTKLLMNLKLPAISIILKLGIINDSKILQMFTGPKIYFVLLCFVYF